MQTAEYETASGFYWSFVSGLASSEDCFFFSSRRRHTRCSRDWSSDVCSSDLVYSTGLAVLPGAPSSVAVAAGSVGIYDNEVQRPTISNAGATYLAFGASSSTLYGYSNGLSIFSVDSTGIASTNQPTSSSIYSNDLRYDNGRLYLTSGGVLDGTSGSLLGTFPAAGPVASDSTVGRAFILNSSGSFGMYDQITAFNESTFVPIGSFSVAGVDRKSTRLNSSHGYI